MQAGSKSPEQPNRPRATPNHAARALHELGMEVDPSHRGPLERLAADLNGHVAEPFRSCLNSAAGAGAKAAPAPVDSAARVDAQRAEFNEAGRPFWGTDAEHRYLRGYDDRKCGRSRETGINPAYSAGWNLAEKHVKADSPGLPPVVLGPGGDFTHDGNGRMLDDEASRAIAAHTTPGGCDCGGCTMGLPGVVEAHAKPATHPGITQREMDDRTRRRVARIRGRALAWPTVAQILNAPGRLTETLADLRQVEALRTAACCLEDKGPIAERVRQNILDQISELDPASCHCCGIETETDPNPDGRGPWRACVSCSWNQSTRNEGGAA